MVKRQEKKNFLVWAKALCFMAIIGLACSQARAQVASAELSGNVLYATGAAIPDAKITATNVGTNLTHSTVSGKSGEYVIPSLPPGDYTLAVEAAGFSKLKQTGINLQVNQQARVDLALKVGQTAETVSVEGRPPMLESESSSVGTVINQKLVNELPLNGRNFVQLATLSPGVNGVGGSASGTIMGGARPDDRRAGSEIFSNGNR